MKNAFEDLLESIPDEEDRKALATLGGKYKEVKDGVLRQSDYSRKMNDLSEEKKGVQADLEQLSNWRAWRRDNWDDTTDTTKEERAAQERISELNQELDLLKSAQESGMNFEEVQAYVDKQMEKRGTVTKDYLEKEFRGKLVDKEFYQKDVDQKLNAYTANMGYIYEETTPMMFQHYKEFDEVLKPAEVLKYANEHGIKDLNKAYEAMVSPRRGEISKKVQEEAITKAREEGRLEALKNQAMGPNGRLPTDSGVPTMGHLEQKIRGAKLADGDHKDEIPEEIKLGSGVGATVAAKYRQDVSEGKVLQSS